MEFSARLVLSSNSGYSKKRVSFFQSVSAYWHALLSALEGNATDCAASGELPHRRQTVRPSEPQSGLRPGLVDLAAPPRRTVFWHEPNKRRVPFPTHRFGRRPNIRRFGECLRTVVKSVSPKRRFVIALHSPGRVVETGLRVSPSEKEALKRAYGIERDTFSRPLSGGGSQNCADFRRFSRECSRISVQARLHGGANWIRTFCPVSGHASKNPLCRRGSLPGLWL